MLTKAIKLTLILLLIFTPIAFGSMELWAFSLMELGILFMIILWAIQKVTHYKNKSEIRNLKSEILLLSLFLALVFFQMIPIPPGIMKIISPKTYELRHILSIPDLQSSIQNSKFPISFVPFATQIEFFKWLTLIGFFLFLMDWRSLGRKYRTTNHLLVVILLMGVFESLYGMIEFFSGHRHILHIDGTFMISSATGTFINRNYFAGYLLMIIPLSIGFLWSREAIQTGQSGGWRHRLSSLDGKVLLIAFGIIVMILGLLFSASRMGILSLLLSFSLMSLLFKGSGRHGGGSKILFLIFGLALLWAAWIGLDAVISSFFSASENFKTRWMIWVNTFQILKDFPLFGSGLGTFGQIFPMYRTFHLQELITHSENDFLQLASEVGLIGFGLLLTLFLYIFLKAVSRIRSLPNWEPQRYIGIGGLIGILALMFHSMVERNLQIPSNAFLFTFLWALVLQVASQNRSRGNGGELR
jgi:O-antigen ligase